MMGTGALIGLLIGFIFAFIGVIFLVIMFTTRKKAEAAKSWPTAQGTVLSSELSIHQDYDSDDHSSSTSYQPVVQYSYSVMGNQYTGSKIAFGANQFDRNTAQNMVNRYIAGNPVSVYYDPNDPAKAVLETQAAGSKVFMIVGIIFAVIGLMSCCLSGVLVLFSSLGQSGS